jgi:uncharacterized membrane protein YtjA (UPF0391 family)
MPAGNLLYWAIIPLVAGVLGFGGIADAAADIARILFWVFLVILLVVLVLNFTGRVRPAAALGLSALLLAAGPAPAQPQRDTIFRDPSGRMTGRAEQRSGGDIIYRDPSGRIIGRAEAR